MAKVFVAVDDDVITFTADRWVVLDSPHGLRLEVWQKESELVASFAPQSWRYVYYPSFPDPSAPDPA